MSKRPFITQDNSPNIIIVPTETFCEPKLKRLKVVNNDETIKTCEQTPSSSKQSESSSDTMSDDSVINTSESPVNKTEDSGQCKQSVNTTEKLRPSWASNYLLSIGDSQNPIKINLSSIRKKTEALKENLSKKKIIQLTATQTKEIKSQQKVNDDSSCKMSKDIVTAKLYPENSFCSRPKTEYKKIKVKFDETNKTMKHLNISSDLNNGNKQCLNSETGLDKQYRSEIIAPNSLKYTPDKCNTPGKCVKKYDQNINIRRSDKQYKEKLIAHNTSKYIPTLAKYKYIKKYDQSTNEAGSSKYISKPNKYTLIKYNQNAKEYIKFKKRVDSSYGATKTNGDKIKYQPSMNKIVKTPQRTVKSKVLKRPSPVKKNYTTSSLYDKQTQKCKEFYTNYKIPKISEKNKKREAKRAETVKDNVIINRISTKDKIIKELEESKCSTPVKSVVTVVDDYEQKMDTTFDLRSKLSRRGLDHYFTKLRNLSDSESTENVPREQRDSLLITVSNDTDENVKNTVKTKLEDIKTTKMKEAKSTTPKFQKIKLVINVTSEKSATSSSETEDEESLGDTEKNYVNSNLDLSFLDDFNIDEIVESLCTKETCDLTSIEFKENAAKDFSFKDNADEVNNNEDSVCSTDTKNERSWLKDNNIKTERDILSNETLRSTDKTEAEINGKCNEAIHGIEDKSMRASLTDFYEEPKTNQTGERLRENSYKLLITDLHNSESKQLQQIQSYEEKESNNTLTVSTISDIPKVAGEDIICKEIKHAREADEVPAVSETRKSNQNFKNSYDIQDSLEICNTAKITDADNVRSADLTEEDSSETIFAIRMFLETDTSLHLNKKYQIDNDDKTSNFIEVSTSSKISEINNTCSDNIQPFHNICSRKVTPGIYTTINKLEVKETINILDKKNTDDIEIKNMLYKNKLQNIEENSKNIQESLEMDISNNEVEEIGAHETLGNTKDIKKYQDKNENMTKENFGDIECDTYNDKDNFETKEMLRKNYTENYKHTQESSNKYINNNKDTLMEIDEMLKQPKDESKNPVKTDIVSECKISKKKSMEVVDEKDVLYKVEVEALETKEKLKIYTNKIMPTESTKKVSNGAFEEETDKTPDVTRFPIHPNDELKKENSKIKLLVISSESVDKEAKGFKTFNNNKERYKSSILSNTDLSGIIDLTNESDEELAEESFNKTTENKQGSENVSVTKEVTKTKEYSQESKTGYNNQSVTETTKNERELKSKNSIQIADKCLNKIIEDKRESNKENSSQAAIDKPFTETTKLEGKLKTLKSKQVDHASDTTENKQASKTDNSSESDEYVNTTIELKQKIQNESSSKADDKSVAKIFENKHKKEILHNNQTANNESITEITKFKKVRIEKTSKQEDDASVAKTIENKQKTENSSQADNDEYFNKITGLKQKLQNEGNSKADDDKSVKKIVEHKEQKEIANTFQISITNKTVAVSVDESKENSEVTVDLQKKDVCLTKKLENRMQQYLNQKHTITSLLHYGSFSKIYECVSENGEKYALKMMDGNKIYRNSKVENLMMKLQRDVPKENYHCVYLYNGFGFTKHWCILMDLYPKNLKQALKENKKSFHIDVIRNLSRQLVSAVKLLKHNNIIHTHITPTHILLNSANDQLKLCGFDEAQYKNAIQFSRNIGTMNYRAPEVILGHSADFKMDVWSTALVMYEMATNIQLFPGNVHNDILYKHMWLCGPVPRDMLQYSKYKNEHFYGLTFMRQLKGGKCIPVPYHTMRKHDLVKKYVRLTYKKDWRSVMSYKQKQQDYARLNSFCELLHKMLVIDPQVRLPVEFVYADPFLFDGHNKDLFDFDH